MTKGAWLLLWFVVLPFLMGAAFHFAPLWVAIPAIAIMAVFWMGVLVQIVEGRE